MAVDEREQSEAEAVSRAVFLRNRARVRALAKVRPVAPGIPCAELRGVIRCAKCGGRINAYAFRDHRLEDIRIVCGGGAECTWVFLSLATLEEEGRQVLVWPRPVVLPPIPEPVSFRFQWGYGL